MKFLIQEDVFDGDEKNLILELKKNSILYILHPNKNFDFEYTDRWFEYGRKRQDTFCYGSLEFIQQIQRLNKSWFKTMCNLHNFDFRIYFHYYQQYLFNREVSFVTYNQLEKIKPHPIGLFVRPCAGYKPKGFSGQVVKELDKDLFDENESYLMAYPRHIDYEWRTIVANQRFVTGCQYKTFCNETKRLGFDPSPDCPQKVVNFVNEVCSQVSWMPDPIFVMDVVESHDRLYVMELNGLSTSGWYDCDYEKITDTILNYYR